MFDMLLYSPFIVRLKYAFQTPSSVYLVMPFIAGGELFHHLQEQCMMTEVGLHNEITNMQDETFVD